MSPRRVVTLPPGLAPGPALTFAAAARAGGADLLELRTDLHHADAPVMRLASILPLLCAARGSALPPAWVAAAALIDVPLDVPSGVPHDAPASPAPRERPDWLILSCHADVPLSEEALAARWGPALGRPAAHVKHVEPLGPPSSFPRLLAVRRWLRSRFPTAGVTVLATGPGAQPFRAILAEENALDYLALGPDFLAAPGQRLLADAVATASVSAPGQERAP
jgi:hypothetical protein